MNEEMNNNYNNTPNYNYEKNNGGVKVLLIILIILVLCLIGLTCYKMFIYDKKNDNNKDNNVVENNEKTTDDNKTNEESNIQNNEENNANSNLVEETDNGHNSSINENNNQGNEITNDQQNLNNIEEKIVLQLKNSGYEKIDINANIQKYYDYVKVTDENMWVFRDYDNYYDEKALIDNKNYFAMQALNDNLMKKVNCTDYSEIIRKKYDEKYVCGYGCGGDCYSNLIDNPENKEEVEMFWQNMKKEDTNLIEEKELKKIVELIYGKGSYFAADFNIMKKPIKMSYIKDAASYVRITMTEGYGGMDTIDIENSKLNSAYKKDNQMLILENLKIEIIEPKKKTINIIVKHTFEKNLYDDNYHYVKTEKV